MARSCRLRIMSRHSRRSRLSVSRRRSIPTNSSIGGRPSPALARFLLMEDFFKYVQGAATSDVLRTSAEACSNLNGTAVPRASIGLPTTGANVTSTQLIAATSTVGEYCQVLGSIHPVDPTAPDI